MKKVFSFKAKDGNVYDAMVGNEEDFKEAIRALKEEVRKAYKAKLDNYRANLGYSGDKSDFISIVWMRDGEPVGFDAHALIHTRKTTYIKGRPTWFAPSARGLGLGSLGQVIQELYWRQFPEWEEARFIRHVNNPSSKKMVERLGFKEHKKLPHSKWVMRGIPHRSEVDEYATKYNVVLEEG